MGSQVTDKLIKKKFPFRYAVYDWNIDKRGRICIHIKALFISKDDAETFACLVPFGQPVRGHVVDVMTGEETHKRDFSIKHFMDIGLSYEEAYEVNNLTQRMDYMVKRYFEKWREQSGFC